VLGEKRTPILLLVIGAICGAILFGILATDFFDSNRREIGFLPDMHEGWAALLGSFFSGLVAFALFFAQRSEDRKTIVRHILGEHNAVRSIFSEIFSTTKKYEELLTPAIELLEKSIDPKFPTNTKRALEFVKIDQSKEYLFQSSFLLLKTSEDFIKTIKTLTDLFEKIEQKSITPRSFISIQAVKESILQLEENHNNICDYFITTSRTTAEANAEAIRTSMKDANVIATSIRLKCLLVIDELEDVARRSLN